MNRATFEILELNHDLLSPRKQAVARWPCEEWGRDEGIPPSWLRSRCRPLAHFSLNERGVSEKMVRESALELLFEHRQRILARRAARSKNSLQDRRP